MLYTVFADNQPVLCLDARASRPAYRIAGMLLQVPMYTPLRAEEVDLSLVPSNTLERFGLDPNFDPTYANRMLMTEE